MAWTFQTTHSCCPVRHYVSQHALSAAAEVAHLKPSSEKPLSFDPVCADRWPVEAHQWQSLLKLSSNVSFLLRGLIWTLSECSRAVADTHSLHLVYCDIKGPVRAAESLGICCCRLKTYLTSLKKSVLLKVCTSCLSTAVLLDPSLSVSNILTSGRPDLWSR